MACPEVERWSEAAQFYVDLALPVISHFSDKALAHHHALWDPAKRDPVLFLEVAAGPGWCSLSPFLPFLVPASNPILYS